MHNSDEAAGLIYVKFKNMQLSMTTIFKSCKVCRFWSLIFWKKVSNFQEHSNIAKIQVFYQLRKP